MVCAGRVAFVHAVGRKEMSMGEEKHPEVQSGKDVLRNIVVFAAVLVGAVVALKWMIG